MKLMCRTLLTLLVSSTAAIAQQIAIPRIEQMPYLPDLYVMRNWKAVARGYDSLAFDLTRTGQYLPLVFLNSGPVNYPGQTSFGLHTYVGDSRSGGSSEAINVLPALVGATLTGANKRNQFSRDWVLMSREFFNNRPAENVYLNSPVTGSGSDWWYDVMPNIFFFQLYSSYPATDDYTRQLTSVADRWLAAVFAMGGSLAPWSHPGLEHRGWYLATMTANNATPHEPEAGGSMAWLLYHASLVTGEKKYRYGAELCLEELNAYASNPAYELQLSYGTLLAARMNAEVGTNFDVEKMVNWCFNVSPIRSWGATVGKWGGIDCSGLIGEINGSNDYAFAMNTFEQVGALVPLVRYDSRFARAMGRWVLNAANASRLFYGNFLPDANQDSRAWTKQFDSASVIAHEALRQTGPGPSSPFATGDAIGGGWAPTNLSLYSSSHVGILGAIIDTTDFPGMLKLDLLATDYFHGAAYPSFLYYNPDTVSHSVTLNVGVGSHDVYDLVSKLMLVQGVSGNTPLTIPSHEAVAAVVCPGGGVVTYDEEKMLINGVVVEFHSGTSPSNHRPRIKGLGAASPLLYLGGAVPLYCTATDRDGDSLSFYWSSASGTVSGTGPTVTWTAPQAKGTYTIICSIADGKGGSDTAGVSVTVVDSALSVPTLTPLIAHPGKVDLGGASTITCRATDPKGLPLTYSWTATGGSISGSDSSATWSGPSVPGNFKITCTVSNQQGGSARDSIVVPVRDYTHMGTAGPILSLPFAGSVTDASGYNNQLATTSLVAVADRFGATNNAIAFNGSTSCVRVTNTPILNCDSAITVAFWMKPGILLTREMFLISHGSWQNRWKISIIPEGKIRWTVKTTTGVKDIDSRTVVASGVYHHVIGTFNGADFELYVDGELETFSSWTGRLLTPAVDLTVGQMLPTDASYNFQGVLDDILVYNYALTYPQVQEVFQRVTGVGGSEEKVLPSETALVGTFPNPFNPRTVISYQLSAISKTTIAVYDLLGREITVLMNGWKNPGRYEVTWDAAGSPSGVYICRMTAGEYAASRRIVLVK